MSNSLYTCNCDVIHEDIVNDVKGKMQPKDLSLIHISEPTRP